MSPRYIGLDPTQVIWDNLKIKWWELVIRKIGTLSFIIAMIVFWCIPVAFVGFLSNINNIIGMSGMHWLSFINNLPPQIMGIITSLLPVVLLSVLMMLIPIIMRGESLFLFIFYLFCDWNFWLTVMTSHGKTEWLSFCHCN